MTQVQINRSLPLDVEPTRSFRALRSHVVFPRHYGWLLGLAAMDVIVTWVVLSTGGNELNALARWAIERAGVTGLISIKAATMALVLAICEYVGRRQPKVGLRLAEFALVANSVAVSFGLVYLTQFSLVVLQLI